MNKTEIIMLLVFTVKFLSVLIFKGVVFDVKTRLTISNIVIHTIMTISLELKNTVVQLIEQILFKQSRRHDHI